MKTGGNVPRIPDNRRVGPTWLTSLVGEWPAGNYAACRRLCLDGKHCKMALHKASISHRIPIYQGLQSDIPTMAYSQCVSERRPENKPAMSRPWALSPR